MIEKVLKNLVYLLYPRNICSYTEKDKYFTSEEYKRLNQIINQFESKDGNVFKETFLNEFKKDHTLKKFADHSLLNGGDRCMTFNVTFIEDGELYTISLFISVIVPYYVIDVRKNMIELYFSELQIEELEKQNTETRKIKEIVFDIETVIEEKFLYKKFPIKILNSVVDDISFEDSEFGYFTLYNAFFNNVIIKEK